MEQLRKFAFSLAVALLSASAVDAQTVVIRTDVPNKAFYKDIFIDSGLRINAFPSMPAVDLLGLSSETMRIGKDTVGNREMQRMLISGCEDDTNGRLLYPDGEPRFRLLYVNGGLSDAHGITLEKAGRAAYRKFYENGGSYVGSCAGGYLPTRGFDQEFYGQGYLGLWPGTCNEAAITKIFPTYILPENSPLLKYCDFGGDNRVDSLKHWNGPYFANPAAVPGTEILCVNELPGTILDKHPSVIAYKADAFTGRLIPIGGHPEQVKYGERLDLMSAILRYALDGQGCAKVKGILENGEVRPMTKSTEDNDPAFTKIGDRQCHHFAFALPKKARNIKVKLEVLEPFEVSLRMAKGTFAFREDATYKVEGNDAVKVLSFETLPAGTWYVGVQCESTVISNEQDDYDHYGCTSVLNGVPYRISVSWDEAAVGDAVLMRGSDVNESIKLLSADAVRCNGNDSIVTKVVFKTSCKDANGVRIDMDSSEEPIYLTMDKKGVVTISTPAERIRTCFNISGLFDGFVNLKKIKNLGAVDFSDNRSLQYSFRNCRSLESIDLSDLDLSAITAMPGTFRYMPNLKEINFGANCPLNEHTEKPSYMFCGTADKDGDRTASKSGKLIIRCTAECAQWLAGTNLRWLHSGNKGATPIEVRLYDYKTGGELFPAWKED